MVGDFIVVDCSCNVRGVAMVDQITSLTKSGMKDWLLQRVSAVILAVYVFFLLGFFVSHPGVDYLQWKTLFSSVWMKSFTFLAMLSLIAHSWVGVWTIFTDYIKCSIGRGFLQIIVVLMFIAYLAWCMQILWG